MNIMTRDARGVGIRKPTQTCLEITEERKQTSGQHSSSSSARPVVKELRSSFWSGQNIVKLVSKNDAYRPFPTHAWEKTSMVQTGFDVSLMPSYHHSYASAHCMISTTACAAGYRQH